MPNHFCLARTLVKGQAGSSCCTEEDNKPACQQIKAVEFLAKPPSQEQLRPSGWQIPQLQPWKIKEEAGTDKNSKDKWQHHMCKFNKMCQPYPRVNTGSETKTSHRDVDKWTWQSTVQNMTGRLSQYVRNWEHITEDWWVLQAVSGYKLEVGRESQCQKYSVPPRSRLFKIVYYNWNNYVIVEITCMSCVVI